MSDNNLNQVNEIPDENHSKEQTPLNQTGKFGGNATDVDENYSPAINA